MKCYYALSLFFAGLLGCTNSGCNYNARYKDTINNCGPEHDYRYYTHKTVCRISFNVLLFINDFGGNPPDITWDKLYQALIDDNKLGFSPHQLNYYIRQISYNSSKKGYRLLFITNHIAVGSNKYSVAMFRNGRLYWKDNFALPEDTVDSLDWRKVNYEIADYRMDKNKGTLKSFVCLPSYIP